jgi:hypothetical protein
MRDIEIKAMLASLIKQLEGINAKVSQMPQVQVQVSSRLMPTLMALQKIEAGNATQVSQITQRCRAFESKNLNDLYMLGLVSKQRRGHESIFGAKRPLGNV